MLAKSCYFCQIDDESVGLDLEGVNIVEKVIRKYGLRNVKFIVGK